MAPPVWNQWTQASGSLSVTLLQGNIPQDEKFESGSGVPLALRWYAEQLLASQTDLVVAPETAVPLLPQQLPEGYWATLQKRFASGKSAALVGIPLGSYTQGYTNSVLGLAPGQTAPWRYDKHHLVPFGEFIPPLFKWFTRMMNIPLGDFNRGPLGQSSLSVAGWPLSFYLAAQGAQLAYLAIIGVYALAMNRIDRRFALALAEAPLARALGTKNVFSASTLDQMPKQLASGLMFGHWLSTALPDISRTDLMLVIGANPLASNGSMWTVPDFKGKAKALQARGGQLIVIDPRRTETAAIANAHHFIRPGADVFLLAALVHTLFAEGLVTLGRVAQWVNGTEEVRTAIAPFTPEAVAARCGMGSDTIRALARQLARTP
eukprot:gene18813-37893_t